jgi:hypothetical protein
MVRKTVIQALEVFLNISVPNGSFILKVMSMGIITTRRVAKKMIKPHSAQILPKMFLKIFIYLY